MYIETIWLTKPRIFWATDANGFASLCLLNRLWYHISQNVELYAHHLSRCPSYALSNSVITGPYRKNDLYRFKAKFAAEVRRNLYNAYLEPRRTYINLISVSANSSAAFPGGEAFRFEFSPNGRTLLAISSSRIYVLDASSDTIEVKRELKTVRRPLAASVTDDASLLAVLSSKYQANIYALTPGKPVKHLQVIVLDNPPKTIALAHEGTVLAAAWQGGIEVFSLAANALSTDRRAVRSDAVGSLTFSGDGSMLIGSSQDLEEPNAVVITAPFYTENDPNVTPREIHSRMWTTQILFPQISSTVSHAALLPGHLEGDAYWLFAYDHTLMNYRAVRTDDTRSGMTYFLSPPTEDRFEFPQPSIAPVATSCGTLAVAGFVEHGLFIYGVPERLDITPDMGSVVQRHEERVQRRMGLTSATGHPEPLMAYSPSVSGSSEMIEEDGLAGKVDWQQSLFVKCQPLDSLEGLTSVKWVENSEEFPCAFSGKRLIVTAPAGVNSFAEDMGEEGMPVDGSRICLLDFEYSPASRNRREYTIEVGDNEAELLTEQIGNLEIEVAMERRRTFRSTTGRPAAASRNTLIRSHTAASPPNPSYLEDVLRRNISPQSSSVIEDPTSPFSRSSGLSRAQTAAGFQHARFPPRPPLGSASYTENPGLARGLPHRASVDSWETPPPPYGQEALAIPHMTHRPHASSPNLRPQSSQSSGHSATVNGNLMQLGTFQNRSQQPQVPAQQQASASPILPPSTRGGFVRQSTSLDGTMNTEHGPSQRAMSQYGGLARSPRPDNIPEEAVEHERNHQPAVSAQPTIALYSALSPVGNADSYLSGRRPQTHDGILSQTNMGFQPSTPRPLSPDAGRQAWPQDQHSMGTPRDTNRENRLSLTGANLQNRLNHPVPPVPGNQSPASPYVAPPIQQSPAQRPYDSLAPSNMDYSMAPNTPSADQMARLNRRSMSPLPAAFQAGPTQGLNTATHDFGAVASTPPRGAWGAVGVPGSPSFNRAIATPNGLTRNNSQGSNRSIGVSRSTPNLLHNSRPSYNRLDTINSVNSAGVPLENNYPNGGQNERIAFLQEGRRTMTDPAIAGLDKKKKKSKSRKDGGSISGEKKKKGTRCVVM